MKNHPVIIFDRHIFISKSSVIILILIDYYCELSELIFIYFIYYCFKKIKKNIKKKSLYNQIMKIKPLIE